MWAATRSRPPSRKASSPSTARRSTASTTASRSCWWKRESRRRSSARPEPARPAAGAANRRGHLLIGGQHGPRRALGLPARLEISLRRLEELLVAHQLERGPCEGASGDEHALFPDGHAGAGDDLPAVTGGA